MASRKTRKIDPRVLFSPGADPRDTLDALNALVRGAIGYEPEPDTITMMVNQGPGEFDIGIQLVVTDKTRTWFRLFQIQIVGETEEDFDAKLVELFPPYKIVVPTHALQIVDEATQLPTTFPKGVM